LVTADDLQGQTFREARNIPPGAFVVLFGGNIGVAAGVDTLVKAFGQLADIENLYLLIAGEGSSLGSCRQIAEDLSCQRIVFHTPWPRDETSMTLASADVLMLPTSGFQSMASVPSKLISYMLASRPVIAAALPNSELAKMIESSQVGWVVEPDRPDLLADRIREVIRINSAELARKGRQGRKYALSNLTREVCLPRIIDLLENGPIKQNGLCNGKISQQAHSS
jgi:colanic acid biosynthesis glycosyl transferase WcaI